MTGRKLALVGAVALAWAAVAGAQPATPGSAAVDAVVGPLAAATPATEGADDAVPALPDPDQLPGGRPGLVFYIAFAINRILWIIKKMRKVFPEKAQPYLPLAAALLGLVYGVLEAKLYGTPWLTAALTGLAGAAGAVAWREGTRAVDHYKNGGGTGDGGTPPKPPDEMNDDELAGAAG